MIDPATLDLLNQAYKKDLRAEFEKSFGLEYHPISIYDMSLNAKNNPYAFQQEQQGWFSKFADWFFNLFESNEAQQAPKIVANGVTYESYKEYLKAAESKRVENKDNEKIQQNKPEAPKAPKANKPKTDDEVLEDYKGIIHKIFISEGGDRPKVYLCSSGVPTVGVGHTDGMGSKMKVKQAVKDKNGKLILDKKRKPVMKEVLVQKDYILIDGKKYKVGEEVPEEIRQRLFKEDLLKNIKTAEKNLPKDAPQEAKDMYLDMFYIKGTSGVQNKMPKFFALMKEGKYAEAQKEIILAKKKDGNLKRTLRNGIIMNKGVVTKETLAKAQKIMKTLKKGSKLKAELQHMIDNSDLVYQNYLNNKKNVEIGKTVIDVRVA